MVGRAGLDGAAQVCDQQLHRGSDRSPLCWIDNYSLRAVITLRASSLRSSFKMLLWSHFVERLVLSATTRNVNKKGRPERQPFLFIWWAVLDSNQRPIG